MRTVASKATQFYGLARIHEEKFQIRPIVSLPGTSIHRLAKVLWRSVKTVINGSNHSVTNTHRFLEKLKEVILEEDEPTVSVGLTALFISISLDLTKEISKTSCKNIARTDH